MIEDTVVLKHDELFVVCDANGDIDERRLGAGFYFRDMRHLSTFRIELVDCPIEFLDNGTDAIDHLMVFLTNDTPLVVAGHEGRAMPQTLAITRRRELNGQLVEQLTITNHNRFPLSVLVRATLAADFRDMFDIRGIALERESRPVLPEREGDRHLLRYESVDGTCYRTELVADPPALRSELRAGSEYATELEHARTRIPGHDLVLEETEPRPVPALVLTHELTLPPGEPVDITYTITPSVALATVVERPQTIAARQPTGATLDWASPVATVTTSNEAFDDVIDRSLSDLRTLVTPLPGGGRIIAAGIPWYVAPFGRDSLIAARELLPFNHGIVAQTLRYLAGIQGRRDDAWRDEQPGKIVHEIRYGEMARRGLVPHSAYYGTVDATPLFLMLMADYLDWTGDRPLFDELRPAVDLALTWIESWGDSDDDGFLDYRPNAHGLVNQGWKDSDDSLQRIDGAPVPPPIGLVEVQGYVYDAWIGLSRHLARYGELDRARDLRERAARLRDRIEDRFWMEASSFYAQAVDGAGAQVDAISSNPAHLLACGVPSDERADVLIARLFAGDLFSGWGIRTISDLMPHYNPMSYHNGSVWPHDNAFVLWGLRRYRRFEALDRLATAMFDAATRFPYFRLPELMCGFARGSGLRDVPIAYPVSCSPQAWAAGVPFVIIETMLGLQADALRNEIRLDPWLPVWLDRVELHALSVGGHAVDLLISGRHDQVDVRVISNPGDVAIVIAPAWPRERAGDVEV